MPFGSAPEEATGEGGETYLHPLVANGPQVAGPSLKHKGGCALDTPGGRAAPTQPPIAHSTQAPSVRETGPLLAGT